MQVKSILNNVHFISTVHFMSTTGTCLGFRSGAKALVVSRYRTVNPPQGDLVLSLVYVHASPNLDILGVKFDSRSLTFEDHVRGIVFVAMREMEL